MSVGIRPENLRIVAADSTDATLRAKVILVEPLGAKDVVHLSLDDHDVRVIGKPGQRPRIGENVGLVADVDRIHFFDDETGNAVRRCHRSGWRTDERFGNVTALNDVSLEIEDGEFFAVLGPPGAGKTTLLRTIVGLEKPDSGDVYADEERITDVYPGDRDIAIMFQNLALYPDKTVFGNLAFPLKQRKLPKDEIRERVEKTAAILHIEHLLKRKPGSSRAASGSGSRWAGRSSATRGRSSSTSRSRRSTRSCASRCARS